MKKKSEKNSKRKNKAIRKSKNIPIKPSSPKNQNQDLSKQKHQKNASEDEEFPESDESVFNPN